MAVTYPAGTGLSVVERRSKFDGSLISSFEAIYPWSLFSDARGGVYYTSTEGDKTAVNYRDINGTPLCQLMGPPTTQEGSVLTVHIINNLVMDERGWLYVGLGKTVMDVANGYQKIPDQQHVNVVALAPWTLSVAVGDKPQYSPGETVQVRVTTSMQATNAISGGANQVQIVTEDGEKIPLKYQATKQNGDTVWACPWVIPQGPPGVHYFDVEANADGIVTDVGVRFASPAPLSNNTGLLIRGSYSLRD